MFNGTMLLRVVENENPYTFSTKPKQWTVIFWFFIACSLAEAYLRTLPPQGHSTVGVPKRCGGFMAIWLRAREQFADNCFQLLLVYIYRLEHTLNTERKFRYLATYNCLQ